ncbi:hypothetical protein [Dactylosporangium sp. NPDC049140]|uniref:hypothetical protein n=1 Tax=Dactylosporangium sp. NPDC049140 TaxID=3155647 RepID=UPI0033EEED92
MSAASTASIPGCDTLLDLFQSGPADAARFEAGTSGPFLAESLAQETDINSMAGTCARCTDADDEGDTTNVSVTPGLTCTLVHFRQPGVDRAETESIAKAAVAKIKRQE